MLNIKKPGWVWVPGDKGKFRPFESFREIRKGKNRGKIEITLRPSHPKKIVVEKDAVRSFPVYEIGGV